MTTERPACGLASLLSMSCRDRAEAFARSLQMRLQTLGLGHAPPDHPAPGDPSTSVARNNDDAPTGSDAAALPEGSWAASARPPLRLGSSSDSDLYYDFDLESPESPGSPAEGTVELVVARQPPRATEPESGLTSSHFDTSPDSDSSDSSGPEAFVSPSTSPGWSSAPSMAPRIHRHPSPSSSSSVKCNGHVSSSPHETSSLGLATNAYAEDEDALFRLESGNFIANADETHSLNNDFATFRSKACIQEQCFVPERSIVNNLINASGSESRADSSSPSTCTAEATRYVSCLKGAPTSKERNAFPSVNVDISNEDEIELLPSDDSSTENLCDKGNTDTDESSFTSAEDREQFSDYICGDTLEDHKGDEAGEESPKYISQQIQDKRMCTSSLSRNEETLPPNRPHQSCHENEISDDIQSAQAEMGILPRRPSWESDGNTVCGRITIIINQEDNLINATSDRDVITIKRVDDTKDNEVPILAKSAEQLDRASEKSSDLKTENAHPRGLQAKATENDEDEESPRIRLRRCSSLKTGKTPPGTPGRKKIVRFADVLGLDLADVRTFLDEIPKIPSSAYDDLPDADLSLGSQANPVVASSFPVPPGHESDLAMTLSMVQPCKMLMPMFQQPGGQPDFLERIRIKFVCLENAVVKDPAMFSIGGVVRVRNLDFQKSVFIRYSIDNWGTYADLQATYVPNSCDGFSDKFSFVLFAHTLSVGQRLEFAIRFQTANGQYWDSNGGANYAFQCLPACSPTAYMEMPSPEDRWGTFY